MQVPDDRLRQIATLLRPQRVVPASIEFVDIAGLVRGASKGEGLGNQFLGHIRNVDAIVLVVRCFADDDVPHVHGAVDPVADVELLLTELALADLQTVGSRMERLETPARSGDWAARHELAALRSIESALSAGQGAIAADSGASLAASGLLTAKPCLVVANVDEAGLAEVSGAAARGRQSDWVRELRSLADRLDASVVPVAAKLELELNDLDSAEAAEYLRTLGTAERGLAAVIQASYRLLRLVTFYTTTGGHEVRAWSIPVGTLAPHAAGRVHTDMERGFIRAEVVPALDLIAFGSVAAAREHGHVRIEGREYVVRDGDVIHIRFNV
jgi:hypothetical protein